MMIKICGLSNAIDAFAAYDEGADALGFVMGGDVQPFEVEPAAQTVRALIKGLRRAVRTFLVTHLLDPEEILVLAQYLAVSGIQISEPLETEALQCVRSGFSGEIIKTVVVQGAESFAELKRVEPYSDLILFDSRVAGYIGGSGIPSDWNLCAKLVAASSKPAFLAGGLNAENVQEAIRITRPAGVDVSTGVSCFSQRYPRKDRKDNEKIHKFVCAVKQVKRR